jgi:hypothetical protein
MQQLRNVHVRLPVEPNGMGIVMICCVIGDGEVYTTDADLNETTILRNLVSNTKNNEGNNCSSRDFCVFAL